MHKIRLIIAREYLTRVRKRTFLLATFLTPLFFIGMYAGVIFLTKKSFEDTHANVYVLDDNGSVGSLLKESKNISYIKNQDKPMSDLVAELMNKEENSYILLIPQVFYSERNVELLSIQKPNVKIQNEVNEQLSEVLRQHEYKNLGIDIAKINEINTQVHVEAKEITDEGDSKISNTETAMGIALALSVLVYISLFLYGSQVMRGVIEEKSSRIIEVIISSVKPYQLMMGKIIGIGLVGLTQFVLWILLSLTLVTIITTTVMNREELTTQLKESKEYNSLPSAEFSAKNPENIALLNAFQAVNFPEIITSFFVFFLGGYLLYSALFAAVGAAVDSETEASQFTLPITMPLLLTYMLSFGVLINDPHGAVATWLSFIPFTSPIAMMVRVPFGVPTWQIIVSGLLLVAGFVFTTWIAAKIYRVGIFMYGKKASYKELIKWLKYKS